MRIDLEKTACRLTVACVLAQVALVLLSWLWSAAIPDSAVRSLLSPQGIRWFFGGFVGHEASPMLVWLVLAALAVGSVRSSGVVACVTRCLLRRPVSLTPLQRFAVRSTLALLLVEVGAVAVLTLPPHAILLSVTGRLFPSSFSIALVPIVAFVCVTVSVFYGLLAGTFHSLADVCRGVCSESGALGPWLLLYVVACQLCHSVFYVFSLYGT